MEDNGKRSFSAEVVEKRVVETIDDQFVGNEVEINRETNFINDLNADSLDSVELLMGLEDEFGIDIPSEAIDDLQTVGQTIDYIKDRLAKQGRLS